MTPHFLRRVRARFVCPALLLLGILRSPAVAGAQNISCTIANRETERTCSANFAPLARIPVTSQVETSAPQYSLVPANGMVTAEDFERGFAIPATPLTLTWRTNSRIRISVRSSNATLTGACNSKPVSAISVGTTSATATETLVSAGAGTLLFTQATPTSSGSGSAHFRVGLNWASDAPASSCVLPLVFTVTPY